ncbi:MAG: type II toxin-antitoxin system PemK/MazF family toxin [Ilumatobacter sp.]
MGGLVLIEQGDIWLLELPHEKPRPCLVLTRDDALPILNTITVAPLTTTVRGIPTEVPLGPTDGVHVESVATFDNVKNVAKVFLSRRLGAIATGRWHEVCAAVRAAIDC